MIRNANFMLQDVAGTQVIVPVGEAVVAFPGMITVNGTGAYIWQLLEQEQSVESLAKAIVERYEVTEERATADVKAFVAQLRPTGALVD